MKRSLSLFLVLSLAIPLFSGFVFEEEKIKNHSVTVFSLKVELLENPEGMDVRQPRLSWQLSGKARGIQQTAYRVLVASSPEKLANNEGDLWDSGVQASEESTRVRYAGKPMESRMEAYWKVKVWTTRGESDWSEHGYWSMGVLTYNEWKSTRWIGWDKPFEWDDVSTFSRLSARYLRKEFDLKKPVKKAKVHIMGLGLYELYINGQKIGDQVLAPTPTDYNHNVKINVFDVTETLQSGQNAIGTILGNGRYFTMRQDYKPYKIKTFGFPKMALQLHVTYEDGTKEIIKIDESWSLTGDGPIRTNNEYDGEEYDARKEMPGWSEAGFDDSDWQKASYVQEPEGTYEAQMNENMKVMMEVHPIGITQLDEDRYIMDMGQNMVGWVQMAVEGQRGQQVKLRFAESLEADGSMFMTNLRDAKVTDIYTLKGEGKEVWEPKFIYHGFRYVEISGFPGKPTVDDFVGKMVYDDMETVGSFETSNETINQIYQNAWWGIAGNYKGMPVDCPQRNERQPWLGDRSTGAYGENFMFDNARLYAKWLEDIRNSQKEDGAIPDVAPAFWRYYSDNMTWAGTYIMIADMLYQQTGDVEVIREHYHAMKKWLWYMKDRYMTEDHIVTKDSYGDWCVPPQSIEAGTGQNADVKRPSQLISTAYYYHFMNMMSEFAALTGNEKDIPAFQALKEKVGKAFNREFYHEEGYYGENKMTENLLGIALGLVPEENKETVFNNLVESIEVEHKGHLSTGVIGVQWLMRTLTENGQADLAYKFTTNRTYPSWGYMLENGATTIWELWHGNVANPSMNSQNHVMLLGDLIVWYYENLAGIKADREKPGFKRTIMDPTYIDGLDHVKASFNSMYGEIKSHWEKKGNQMVWSITIPANSTALVYFPVDQLNQIKLEGKKVEPSDWLKVLETDQEGKVKVEIGSGDYRFSFPG